MGKTTVRIKGKETGEGLREPLDCDIALIPVKGKREGGTGLEKLLTVAKF